MNHRVPRITLDTNVCNVIHEPDKWPTLVAPDDARKMRAAISDKRISGFVSEATLFIECLGFPDKLSYLAVAGTPGPRPEPHPNTKAMFDDLGSIGIELLHAPLIGAEKFIESIPWTKDAIYPIEERQKRFFDFIRPLPRHAPLKAYGESLLPAQPPVPPRASVQSPWAMAIKREWDGNPDGRKAVEKVVRPVIGEWCDGLILGSHVAYGNDIFCTADQGKSAGANSLLHQSKRAALVTQGIRIMTPREVAQHLGL
ncbi:hypothetical protein [Sinorhizobium meliloti]|uniref:hypothetical protein n=1 Tax=Rhizobium meliloti TaxID=382 RepID=UPI0012954DF2|nr:hypothetical protein [Sinorhizobium meliloti]MQU91736.1 hypothetical protein [Sinorhizobium meliloti]MQV01786.1 hypothetical protein [Sinorhizobium meliloti]